MEWTNIGPDPARPIWRARGDWGSLAILPPMGQMDPTSRISFTPAGERAHPWDLGQVWADRDLATRGCESLMQPLPQPQPTETRLLDQAGFALSQVIDDLRLYRRPWGRSGFFQLGIDSTHLNLSFEKTHNARAYTLCNLIWQEGEHVVAWPAGRPVYLALRWALMLAEQWDPKQVFKQRRPRAPV